MRWIAAAAHQRPQRAANVHRAPGLPSASPLRHPTRTESTHRPIPHPARSGLGSGELNLSSDPGSITDDGVDHSGIRADSCGSSDDGAADDRTWSQPDIVEQRRSVDDAARRDNAAGPDCRTAGELRVVADVRTRQHKRFANRSWTADDGAILRTRSAEPATKSAGVPRSRQ